MPSINWLTLVISIPKSYLTLVSGTLYELDTNQFRLDVLDIMDNADGMPFKDPFSHNTEVTVAGVTYARFIELVNNYSVTFEDDAYTVKLAGSNNNIFDVENGILNQNSVSVISGNSAGLIVVNTAGTVAPTQQEIRDAMTLATTETPADDSIDDKLQQVEDAAIL